MAWMKKGRKENDEPETTPMPRPTSDPGEDTASHFGKGLHVEGTIQAKDKLVISGTIKGQVDCEGTITVTRSGVIDGSVRCRSIAIHGTVKGDVDAVEKIDVEATGRLVGDIKTKTLINQPGGFFQGYSHMITKDRPKTERAPTKPEPAAVRPVAAQPEADNKEGKKE